MERKTVAPVSTRYPSDTLKRLDRRAQAEGRSRSTLIQRYVAEGIEMDEHPGIVFRSGPAGRRPGLVGGPDVWEVVAVHRSFDDAQRTADWLDQPPSAIETALRYYEAHRAEIDEWIRRNEEAAEAAERVARARQAAS
jgi:predicted transcriptional regulator